MKYLFKLDEKNTLEIDRSFWLGKVRVFFNGTEVIKQAGEKFFRLKPGRKSEKLLKILGAGIDGVPRAYIDGKRLQLARKLEWYENLVACAPLILVFIGGALGGAIAAVATVFNFSIIRMEKSYAVRLLYIFTVTIASLVIYLGLSYIFLQLAG